MDAQIVDLLKESALLMLVGMGVVFAFLSLLIVATNSLARFANPVNEADAPTVHTPSLPANQLSPQTVAAIGAAIHQYRKDNHHA